MLHFWLKWPFYYHFRGKRRRPKLKELAKQLQKVMSDYPSNYKVSEKDGQSENYEVYEQDYKEPSGGMLIF